MREPELIKPFIKRQFKRTPQKLICNSKSRFLSRNLDSQKELIDCVRSRDNYLIIILDACRYDFFKEEYSDYLSGDLKPVFNEARDTFEYVQKIWADYYPEVEYVSGATPINSGVKEFSDHHLKNLYNGYRPGDHIKNIVDVWATGWNTELGTVPPEKVTGEALSRSEDSRKMVAHYFQPHAPYIGEKRMVTFNIGEDAEPLKGNPVDHKIWDMMKNGEISRQEADELYRENLIRVLETVENLIKFADFKNIIVTADHGEALGEHGVYAHPRYVHHPKVRVVPWLEVDK